MVLSKLNVTFDHVSEAQAIIGQNDQYLRIIEQIYDVNIVTRGNEIQTDSTDETVVKHLDSLFYALKNIVETNYHLTDRDIIYLANMATKERLDEAKDLYLNRMPIVRTYKGKTLYAKSVNQKKYVELLKKKDLVFSIGPAGTGKTYIPVLYALSLLKNGDINKIILTRPAVEAGESLGFLPGDLKEKVDPYLQPLYDALNEVLGMDQVDDLMERKVIEVAPLAYMRGRTLSDAFIILDEAQNTTSQQMKMFLTRLGTNSKMVVTGDITQIDLPNNATSGLIQVVHMLRDIRGVGVIEFHTADVVRHPIVQEILRKYEEHLK